MDDIYPNIETICRLCLKELKESFNIFNTDIANLSIPMRIMTCASLEVQPSDGLPKEICNDCRYQLEKSFLFRKRCQATDGKLRKHIRLLSVGKKSRVFSKTADEEYEDELEFEDSLNFIKEIESIREKTKEQQLRKSELSKMRQELTEKIRNELRIEVRDSVKEELRSEVRAAERENMRDEVKEQYRIEQLNELIEELQTFLKQKQENAFQNKKTMGNATKGVVVGSERKLRPRNQPQVSPAPKVKKLKLETNDDIIKDKKTPERFTPEQKKSIQQQATLNFQILSPDSNEIASVAPADEENESSADVQNFIILNTDEEDHDESDYQNSPNDDELQFIDDVDNNITSYKIKDNGEIQYFEKNNMRSSTSTATVNGSNDLQENIVVLNFESGVNDDLVEFVNLDEKIIFMRGKNVKSSSENEKQTSKIVKRISTNGNTSIPENNIATNISPSAIVKSDTLPQRTTDTVKTFSCDSCPMVFSTEYSYNRHMRTHEKMELKGVSYQCPECQIFVSCKSALTRHIVVHTGERPYVCDECGKSFVQREILKRHKLVHTGVRPHKCPHCPRKFSQKVNMKQHVNKMHLAVPKVQQHQCHLCQKRFNHASGLSRHLATHSGVAFQCTECDRTFGDRSSIKRHILHVHSFMDKSGELVDADNKIIEV